MTFQYIYYAVNSWLIFLCIALLLFYIIDVGVDCWILLERWSLWELYHLLWLGSFCTWVKCKRLWNCGRSGVGVVTHQARRLLHTPCGYVEMHTKQGIGSLPLALEHVLGITTLLDRRIIAVLSDVRIVKYIKLFCFHVLG